MKNILLVFVHWRMTAKNLDMLIDQVKGCRRGIMDSDCSSLILIRVSKQFITESKVLNYSYAEGA